MNKFLKVGQMIWRCFCLVLIAGLFAAGCASSKQEDSKPPAFDAHSNDESFAVGDLVIVKFSGTSVPIPAHEEQIKEDGTITLPLLGAVKASGKTARELEEEIRDLIVPDPNPHLSITVTSGQSFYFVGGQVKWPGRQVYPGPTTVTKAIESAGGFTDFALRSRVQLTRAGGKRFVINCIKAEKEASLDLPVYPGDRIDVLMPGPTSDMFRR